MGVLDDFSQSHPLISAIQAIDLKQLFLFPIIACYQYAKTIDLLLSMGNLANYY